MVYDDVPADRHQWARLTLEAHLIKLARDGRVTRTQRNLAAQPRMKARLAISLHAVSVRRGGKWVLDDITWRLRPGERWALARREWRRQDAIAQIAERRGLADSHAGSNADGRSFRLAGRSVDLIDAKRRIAYIGAERQDKYARYGWNLSVRDLVATGLHQTDLLLSPVTAREPRA